VIVKPAPSFMPNVYVSIGSNIDRDRHIRSAVHRLALRYASLSLSSVYESAAIGFEGENFYNLAAGFKTDESLDSVAAFITEIEAAHGRSRDGARFTPRTLDIDLLLYGDLIRHDARYDIPRGEIEKHAFVLRPLAEIAPAKRHPEIGKSFDQMWKDFDRSGQKLRKIEFSFTFNNPMLDE
jgi:2-amino-4-hydroxy-6-hydroxymethyldihydropteridine diphosphokinase